MNTIYEATKFDGTKVLLTDKFLRDIFSIIRKQKYKQEWRKRRLYGEMLANYCYCRDYARIDEIKYGIDCPMKRENIIECDC